MEHVEHGQDEREEQSIMGLIPNGRHTKHYGPSVSHASELYESCYEANDSSSLVVDSLSRDVDLFSSASSSSSHKSLYEPTEEELAVASYLLLLSNCNDLPYHATPVNEAPPIQFVGTKFKSNASKIVGPDGRVGYYCYTCGRNFCSFQALGGHRASHKKLLLAQPKHDYSSMLETSEIIDEEKEEEDMLKLSMNSFPMAIAKVKVHQCTICGSEFTSGQALGGHMRRHRKPIMVREAASCNAVATDMEVKEEDETLQEYEASSLTLDLNCPAPSEGK